MAILGVFVDRQPGSLAGGAWGGATNVTSPHSLPATNPDAVIALVNSQQAASINLSLGGLRGNASLNTAQVFGGSAGAASAPILAYELVSLVFHSGIR